MDRTTPRTLLLLVLLPIAAAADPPVPSLNQPWASYWFPNELLTWSAASDPDAPYNRSGVPLADRFTNPATQVNPNARDGEGRVVVLGVMYPSTSNNPSQGADTFGVYAFNYWQYVDQLVFWGGSAGEGLILAPGSDVIDAGHRNGVPVLGTIFFPPNVFGGDIQWVHDLVQESGSSFPVADKLIEVADEYGFDGWFINQETDGGDSTLAVQMQEFLLYYQANKPANQSIMWYDAMIDNGNVAWQNELNERNAMFFHDGGVVSQDIFLNFGWGAGTRLADSRTKALSLGRSPYEVYGGVNVQAVGYNANVMWDKLFPPATVHTTSLGFFGSEWTYTSAVDSVDFYARANRMWVGENRDPSDTATVDDWKGIAHYIPAKSPVNDVPFVTNFNTGQGSRWAVDGAVLATGDWNHRSTQDVLPTWRWIAESTGTALVPRLDWSDAYYGGTCLAVGGELSAANATHLKLYKTSLALAPDANLSVAYKRGAAGVASRMQVGVSFESDPSVFAFFDVDSTGSAGWNLQTIPLGAHAGETIAVISLRFDSPVSEPGYSMKVGRIAVIEGAADPPAPATASAVDVFEMTDARNGSVRLRWTHSTDPVYWYNVYRRNPDLTRTWLGSTPNDAYFVRHAERLDEEVTTVLEIEAVGLEFAHAAVETTSVFWGFDPPNDAPCAFANGPYCGEPDAAVAFSSAGSVDPDGTIVAWHWSFGDGDTSPDENPSHAYAAGGTYSVVLTVTDDGGKVDADTTLAHVTDPVTPPFPTTVWFPFDEGSGMVAGDSSGQGNDGEVNGPVWTSGVAGGGALAFDGVDDWVRVPDYPKSPTTMSVTAWAWAESRPAWASIAKNWALNSGQFHLGLFEADGDLQVDVAEADEDEVSLREGAGTPFPLGSWQHVAMTADGETVRLYRNGTEVDSAPYDGTLKTTRPALGIGVKTNGGGTAPNPSVPGFWHGVLDDVRLYDRALCPGEVAAMWANASATPAVPAAGPVAFSLSQNFPNPFGPSTRIRYALPRAARVRLTIFDVTGRRVTDLVDGERPPGVHTVAWSGNDASGQVVGSGVYFYRLRAGEFEEVRKLLRLR